MKSVKPLGNRILVKKAVVSLTKGGILLPDTAKEKPKIGEVIACGPGSYDEAGKLHHCQVKKGDTVYFNSFSALSVDIEDDNDAEYLIMSEDDVLAVIG